MITVRFNGAAATINRGVWRSNDKRLERMLRTYTPTGEDGTYDPDPDYTKAASAARQFGGKIVSAPEPEKLDPTRVY